MRYASEEEQPELISPHAAAENGLDLQKTKEKLSQLKRQMEEYEQRERELEELRQRREKVMAGQKLMHERLTQALAILERSEHEMRRELEYAQTAQQAFHEHLQKMEEINATDWTVDEMKDGLNHAIAQIEQARLAYNQAHAKIQVLNKEGELDEDEEGIYTSGNTGDTFFAWFQKGLAFTFPLLLLLAALILILLVRK
ncbi:MAG: hypothetical protein V1746_04210 [bacterium]